MILILDEIIIIFLVNIRMPHNYSELVLGKTLPPSSDEIVEVKKRVRLPSKVWIILHI